MSRPILYSAWFCPFAQRSWITLVHKGVNFEYKEQNPYDKSDEWLAINPRGLVPALVMQSDVVIESGIINEYVDEKWNDHGSRYLPPFSKPLERAKARVWLDFVDKKLIPPGMIMLKKPDKGDQEKAAASLIDNLKIFIDGMNSQGPFFDGPDLSCVDIFFIPWALRFYILKEYRGFVIPSEGEIWSRYQKWYDAARNHPSVKPTIQDEAKLLEIYGKLVQG